MNNSKKIRDEISTIRKDVQALQENLKLIFTKLEDLDLLIESNNGNIDIEKDLEEIYNKIKSRAKDETEKAKEVFQEIKDKITEKYKKK